MSMCPWVVFWLTAMILIFAVTALVVCVATYFGRAYEHRRRIRGRPTFVPRPLPRGAARIYRTTYLPSSSIPVTNPATTVHFENPHGQKISKKMNQDSRSTITSGYISADTN